MTDTKQNNGDPASDTTETRPKTLSKKERRLKTLFAAIVMLIPFSVFMYMIFGGEKKPSEPDAVDGYNVSVPDGRSEPIIADKRQAYERTEPQSRTKSTAQNPFLLLEGRKNETAAADGGENNIEKSQTAYRTAARQVENFYREPPRRTAETDSLRRQIALLTAQLEERPEKQRIDPLEVVERSYALASKYMDRPQESIVELAAENRSAEAVCQVPDNVVSSLPQFHADTLPIEDTVRDCNRSFYTAVSTTNRSVHRGIRACVAGEQTITNGSRIRLRLLEAMSAGGKLIPARSELFGTASIVGQRLSIAVTSIEKDGDIVSVDLAAHDMDGQLGLYIPNSTERTAAKEAAAAIGGAFGSGISFARSAGQQIAMDVVRGTMAGGSQYVASKLREAKAFVKADYELLLIPKK